MAPHARLLEKGAIRKAKESKRRQKNPETYQMRTNWNVRGGDRLER